MGYNLNSPHLRRYAMREERLKILKMLEDRKITVEDAARLLEALPCGQSGPDAPRGGKRIRVRVTDPKTGKQTANLTVPVGLAKFAAKFIPEKTKQELAAEGIDIDNLISQVMSENIGKVVDVESDKGNVQISIE
jgi:hypothetical protein